MGSRRSPAAYVTGTVASATHDARAPEKRCDLGHITRCCRTAVAVVAVGVPLARSGDETAADPLDDTFTALQCTTIGDDQWEVSLTWRDARGEDQTELPTSGLFAHDSMPGSKKKSGLSSSRYSTSRLRAQTSSTPNSTAQGR